MRGRTFIARAIVVGASLFAVTALCQCATPSGKRQVRTGPVGSTPVGRPVPLVELKPPPPDRWVKLRGRNLVLKSARVVSDVSSPPHRPDVPEPYNREGAVLRGTYKVCVGTDGNVRSVSTLKTAGNGAVDQAFRSAIQGWRHQPTRLGAKRVPHCYPLGLKVTYARRS